MDTSRDGEPAGCRYCADIDCSKTKPGGDSLNSETTAREVVNLIVELGLVDQSTPRRTLAPDQLDKPLSYYGQPTQHAVCTLLSYLEIRYTVNHKTFRDIGDRDDAERLECYRSELETIASHTRGLVTVSNVRLVEADTEWELRFDWNDETMSWPVEPGDEEEAFEATLTFSTGGWTQAQRSAFVPCIPWTRTVAEKLFSATRRRSTGWASVSGSPSVEPSPGSAERTTTSAEPSGVGRRRGAQVSKTSVTGCPAVSVRPPKYVLSTWSCGCTNVPCAFTNVIVGSSAGHSVPSAVMLRSPGVPILPRITSGVWSGTGLRYSTVRATVIPHRPRASTARPRSSSKSSDVTPPWANPGSPS